MCRVIHLLFKSTRCLCNTNLKQVKTEINALKVKIKTKKHNKTVDLEQNKINGKPFLTNYYCLKKKEEWNSRMEFENFTEKYEPHFKNFKLKSYMVQIF